MTCSSVDSGRSCSYRPGRTGTGDGKEWRKGGKERSEKGDRRRRTESARIVEERQDDEGGGGVKTKAWEERERGSPGAPEK
jgi:hypothetical protein